METIYGWNRPAPEAMKMALAAANKAVELDRKNEWSLSVLGLCKYFTKQLPESEDLYRRAIAINSNHAGGLGVLGQVLVWRHKFDEAEDLLNQPLTLSPRDAFACFHICNLGFSAFFRSDPANALLYAERAYGDYPNNPVPLRLMAGSLGLLGRLDEAREVLNKLTLLAPGMTISLTSNAVFSGLQEDIELYSEHLRRAGMPE